ncbi:signal transduction histidine kinase [Lactiplantibacillus fabifermentans T30PCM01]|uniref:histidine kinase n=2 Tax=Lactiplantibacillus fabifermentans TaxID=483011 RepID=A0A0R2NT40_9LACO|nr:signal transduction histidine kinase [Lactiplantibacillus fabifermentans T30PCM01]KRO28034.1 histidine protein kinase [Lactiplantibacillus fabifermentans DSM 21115]
MKQLNWSNYIWLVYLPFSVMGVATWWDRFWLGMLGVFLVIYILVAEKPAWHPVTIPAELIVTGAFALFDANNYLLVYPAWQVSFILARHPKKQFYWFAATYYTILVVGLWHDYLLNPRWFDPVNYNLMGLLFPIMSPILSYVFARSAIQRQNLAQTNRRLQVIVQRDERERIARDLHDTLGQSFSMITLKAELANKLLTKNPAQVAPELADIAQTSRDNLQLVRSIVNDLHQQSLSEALLTQNQNLVSQHIWLTTTGEAAATQWPTAVQGCLAAVIVEAITNVIRHAHAHQVTIIFNSTATQFEVKIQDDGRGSQDYTRPGANGVTGMQARLAALQGTFAIAPQTRGTQISVTIPKEGLA